VFFRITCVQQQNIKILQTIKNNSYRFRFAELIKTGAGTCLPPNKAVARLRPRHPFQKGWHIRGYGMRCQHNAFQRRRVIRQCTYVAWPLAASSTSIFSAVASLTKKNLAGKLTHNTRYNAMAEPCTVALSRRNFEPWQLRCFKHFVSKASLYLP